jgi:hypothetical protein
MKTAVIAFVLFVLPAVAREEKLPSAWRVTLSDSSVFLLEPRSEAIQLTSDSLGRALTIPLTSIEAVTPNGGAEVKVAFRNGDRLSGRLTGGEFGGRALFGDVAIRPELIRKIERVATGASVTKLEPPAGPRLDFGGYTWDLWRTGWAIDDGKLTAQRKVRPGYKYGHWANGRGGMAITGNGDQSWTDYELAFDYKMLPANREFFHAHIPGETRGMTVVFRAKAASESWNQPETCYKFGINPNGSWGLHVLDGWHMPGHGWSSTKRAGKRETFVSGKAESCDDASEGRLRIRVKGNTITAWLGDEKLVEFTHDGGAIEPIPYGGFGVQWRYESMGWIKNLEVEKF